MSTSMSPEEVSADSSDAPTTQFTDTDPDRSVTAIMSEENVSVDVVSVTPSVVPVEGSTITVNVTEATTTATTTTTVAPTEENNSSSTVVDVTILPTSTTLSTTTTTTEVITSTIPAETTTTTMAKQSTTTSSSTTTALHECVTSMPCIDPNSHCVNMAGLNTCQCRTGFHKSSVGGWCQIIPASEVVETTSTTTTTQIPETSTHPTDSSTTAAPAPIPKVSRSVTRYCVKDLFKKSRTQDSRFV